MSPTTRSTRSTIAERARRIVRSDHVLPSLLSVVVGLAAAAGAVVFREAIDLVQLFALGFSGEQVATGARATEGWRIVAALTVGGLLVGLFTQYLMPGGRPQGVAEVIEASALRAGRMSARQGLGAALISALSIGCGASTGREGPAVHLGASLASWLARPLHLNRSQSRTLLGCGVASAVAASFNAPIAGVFFALEVVIGHYALQAFAPIVVAGVTGTVVSRIYFGDFPAFILPPKEIVSFFEFPAFGLLGFASGIGAIAFMRLIPFCRDLFARLPGPVWLRPAAGGLVVGVIALWYPEILGVGYEATDNAIKENYDLTIVVTLLAVKMLATSVSIGCGFGGGVFSPSLFLGAMLGATFGIAASIPFPDLWSGTGTYALVGMGAVAGAVLGAPISTILMLFELTNDYRVTIAVMIAVVVASTVTRVVVGPSFFIAQLRARGRDLIGGHEVGVLATMRVHDLVRHDHVEVTGDTPLASIRDRLAHAPMGEIFVVDGNSRLVGTITLADLGDAAFDRSRDEDLKATDVARADPPFVNNADDLQQVMGMFARTEEGILAVVDNPLTRRLRGCLHERDVMRAYNRALVQIRAEEHGEADQRIEGSGRGD